MELFTLGIGNYTETDVREAARALTGWRVDAAAAGSAAFDRSTTTAGPRPCSGRRATSMRPGLVAVLVARPASARFVAAGCGAGSSRPVRRAPDASTGSWRRTARGRDVTAGAGRRRAPGVPRRAPRRWSGSPSSGWSAPAGAAAACRRRCRPAALRRGLTGLGQVPFDRPTWRLARRRRLAHHRGGCPADAGPALAGARPTCGGRGRGTGRPGRRGRRRCSGLTAFSARTAAARRLRPTAGRWWPSALARPEYVLSP